MEVVYNCIYIYKNMLTANKSEIMQQRLTQPLHIKCQNLSGDNFF